MNSSSTTAVVEMMSAQPAPVAEARSTVPAKPRVLEVEGRQATTLSSIEALARAMEHSACGF